MRAVDAARRLRRWIVRAIVLGAVALAVLLLAGHARNHPEDMPWTELDLTQPVGAFTGRKLVGLADEGEKCERLLRRAGVRFAAAPDRGSGECRIEDAVRLATGGALEIGYRPRDVATQCPVAAGLALWEWHFVQPAAIEHLGRPVAGIEHYGSFSCRRVYGRSEGAWSEHATANAIDVAAFILDDGTRVSVLADWEDGGPKGRFLDAARDGACRLFATVLSPDYNAAHRDHLHLDQAQRGAFGWRGCR